MLGIRNMFKPKICLLSLGVCLLTACGSDEATIRLDGFELSLPDNSVVEKSASTSGKVSVNIDGTSYEGDLQYSDALDGFTFSGDLSADDQSRLSPTKENLEGKELTVLWSLKLPDTDPLCATQTTMEDGCEFDIEEHRYTYEDNGASVLLSDEFNSDQDIYTNAMEVREDLLVYIDNPLQPQNISALLTDNIVVVTWGFESTTQNTPVEIKRADGEASDCVVAVGENQCSISSTNIALTDGDLLEARACVDLNLKEVCSPWVKNIAIQTQDELTLECIDTDPIGDGFGWDGEKSCPIEES